jgi:hypothetical protein
MKTRSPKTLVIFLVILVSLVCGLRPAYACGPFSRYAIFTYVKHPDIPFDGYTRGSLGVLQPSYARSYLVVAYRQMKGGSFNQQEQQALASLWNERLDYNLKQDEEDLTALWLAARKKVPGIGADPQINDFRIADQADYSSFLNCPADAFRNATKTLEERITKFGAASAEVKEWTLAQDQVFANCVGGEYIPEPAPATLAPMIQADRTYQIAAAHFYATNFDEAKNRFEKIAADANSQWREQASYLVARSLLRKASLDKEANRQETLAQAEAQLNKVVSETGQPALRQSAQNLLNLVKLRARPAERLRELSQSLLQPTAKDDLKQELWDYTVLLDRYLGEWDERLDEDLKKAIDAAGKDDLTDWLLSFQAEPKDSLDYSLGKWEKTNAVWWLIAALSKVDAKHAQAAALMSAAERIEPASPAFATTQFHLIRLLIEKGDRDGARRRLDAMLQSQTALPASAANLFRNQRMLLAENLDEFLKYAQRQPAGFSWDDDGRETPIDLKEDEELKDWAGRALFDVDSLQILNHQFPLALLREAADSKALPDHLRKQIALAAWTRAAILDDVENAKALTPVAAGFAPELRPLLKVYLAEISGANRKPAALYAILKFPGLQPYVAGGTGRMTPLGERDLYRDNWWCEASLYAGSATSEEQETNSGSSENSEQMAKQAENWPLEFLDEAQRETAKKERAQLASLGAAPSYLAREVVAWANRTPNDLRLPESLHIAVTATRYGCTDKDNGKWSKAAFDLLHKRYPKTTWAKKTPYWFKGL